MDPSAPALIDAFVAAYRPYVTERLSDLALPAPLGLDAALTDGEAWLERELTELVSVPHARQLRGPLELFQEAMKFPSATLAESGVEPVARDPVAVNALPGDTYGLAPASSAELGEKAWQAHLVWGAAKASALAASRGAIVISDNLMDRTRIEAAARAAGWRPVRSEKAAELAIVDLGSREAEQVLASLISLGVRVVAYGPHVEGEALDRAKESGAEEALPRSRFFARLPRLFDI